MDLYELLGLTSDCDQTDIRKAYRKRALECHPDKNPDNPKAAERFHELSKALAVLTDAIARTAYDNVLKSKKAAELRNNLLDSKRKKLKTDLEQRELIALHKLQATHKYGLVQKTDEELLEEHIKRLRQEGSKLLQEEQKLMRQHLQRNLVKLPEDDPIDSSQYRIKIKWAADMNDHMNGGYDKEILSNYLKKYGDIDVIVISKKKGSGLVQFKTQKAAEMAISYEKGRCDNPLKLSWITPVKSKNESSLKSSTDREFENLVMRKLRQAEERKQLIEKIKREEGYSDGSH